MQLPGEEEEGASKIGFLAKDYIFFFFFFSSYYCLLFSFGLTDSE